VFLISCSGAVDSGGGFAFDTDGSRSLHTIAPRFAGTSKTLPAALLQSARTAFERLSNSLCMRLPWIVSAIAPRVWCGSRPCNRAAFDLLSAWLSER
jgi:hypothetical protein